MFLVFEGVRSAEQVLSVLFSITELDIQWAPNLLGVKLDDESDADFFFSDPTLQELDDTPEGFWSMSVEDDDYFLDRCEEAFRRHGCRPKKAR